MTAAAELLLNLEVGDEILVDGSNYGADVEWCALTGVSPGTAAVYPFKVTHSNGAPGQYGPAELSGWRLNPNGDAPLPGVPRSGRLAPETRTLRLPDGDTLVLDRRLLPALRALRELQILDGRTVPENRILYSNRLRLLAAQSALGELLGLTCTGVAEDGGHFSHDSPYTCPVHEWFDESDSNLAEPVPEEPSNG